MSTGPNISGLKVVYGVSAVLFLAILAISPLKDVFQEWRGYQHGYNKLVEEQPVRIPTVPVKLRQAWIQDLDRVDRCGSCHLGLRETALADAPNPFRSHPKVYHDIEEFGCTICHQGQGRSTEVADAHYPTAFWDEPILPKRYVEAGCGTCHQERQPPSAPVLSLGRELLEEYNCIGCHTISGFEKTFAPGLDGIGEKVDRQWLSRWLTDPASLRSRTKMPDFILPEDEVRVLAELLMSFKNFSGDRKLAAMPAYYSEMSEDEDFIDLGKTRFREARCISCHSVEGKGGVLAPDLGKIGSKVNPAWLYSFLTDPQKYMPGVPMPEFGFTPRERAAITAYMMSEFIDWDAPEEELAEYEPSPDFYERGIRLFNKYNCAGCHQLSDPNVSENPGPELTDIGDKAIYELDFGHTDIPRTRYDFIYHKLSDPRSFRVTLRMPQFSLTEEQRIAITTALLAQRGPGLPSEYLVHAKPTQNFEPQGPAGELFTKYNCQTCHQIYGDGGTIAPELSRVGSILDRSWVEQYFGVPFSRRPIQAERMPNLFMKPAEIRILTDYLYTVFLDDSLQIEGIPSGEPELTESGRKLFWETYGCQSCHQVGSRGGYVGPPLDGAGERLNPGWIVRWLSNPQRYKPDTLEPRTGMTESDARAIAEYLVTLGKT
jgi:mono/diheme cytochrome c family protein